MKVEVHTEPPGGPTQNCPTQSADAVQGWWSAIRGRQELAAASQKDPPAQEMPSRRSVR